MGGGHIFRVGSSAMVLYAPMLLCMESASVPSHQNTPGHNRMASAITQTKSCQ